MNKEKTEIGVAIVTYNRLDMLKKAITAYERQTLLPRYILIVNNNSDDGTHEFLETWEDDKNIDCEKIILTVNENTGGSGGFHLAQEKALKLQADWIWLADDDAFPEPDAIEIANNFIKGLGDESDNVAAICSSVINHGQYEQGHRRVWQRNFLFVKDGPVADECYSKEFFDVDTLSYVGAILNKSKLEESGIARKEFFIYCDDTEHSIRLRKTGRIICVPKIRVVHDTLEQGFSLWKVYYAYRNQMFMYKEHLGKKYYYSLLLENCCRVVYWFVYRRWFERSKILRQAIHDAIHNVSGRSDKYYPGMKK